VTVFVENFPGIPDNIVLSHKSGLVWVGFAIKRTRPFSVFDFLADKPWIRLAIARLLPVVKYPFLDLLGRNMGSPRS